MRFGFVCKLKNIFIKKSSGCYSLQLNDKIFEKAESEKPLK